MSGNCNQSFSQSQKWCNVLGLSKRTLQACSNLNGVKSNAKVLRCATTALATRWKHISCSSHFEGPQIRSKGLQKCAATVVRAAACSFLLLAMWTSFNEASHGKHDALWVLMVIPSWEASSQKKMYACSALAIHIYTCIYIYLFIYLFIYVFMYLFIYLCILYTICIYILYHLCQQLWQVPGSSKWCEHRDQLLGRLFACVHLWSEVRNCTRQMNWHFARFY